MINNGLSGLYRSTGFILGMRKCIMLQASLSYSRQMMFNLPAFPGTTPLTSLLYDFALTDSDNFEIFFLITIRVIPNNHITRFIPNAIA